MRGSHFITPSGVQPMFASPPVVQAPPARAEASQREYHLQTAHQGRETTRGIRPRSSTSSSSTASVRTVSQSQIGMNRVAPNGEASNDMTTPRKPSGTTASMKSASSSGSARLASPPPPPPRDMPLPPLPPLPSNSSLSRVSASSSQTSLRQPQERRQAPALSESQGSTSGLRGLGLGSLAEGVARDPRPRDVSAPAYLNGGPTHRQTSASGHAINGGQDQLRAKGRKMSSPPLGGLFTRMAGKSTTSLNSTSGASGKVGMSDTPSEFGVLAKPGQQVDTAPLAPPAAERSGSFNSLPSGKERGNIPPVGLGRSSTSYQGARHSEEVSRKLASSDLPSDFSKLVQPRKSSGGLKALFSRNKNKDRTNDRNSPSPVLPSPEPAVASLATKRRASEDMLRSRKTDQGSTRPLQALAPLPLRSTTLSNTVDTRSPSQTSPYEVPVRSTTPQPLPPPSTPTPTSAASAQTNAGSAPSSARTQSFESTSKPLPPSVSLHLGDLPQLDLSLGSTFDDLLKSLEFGTRMSPRSPKKASPGTLFRPEMHARRRSRSFSEFSHSSSGKSLHSREVQGSIGRLNSRTGSNTSLAADVAAYRALEVAPPSTDQPPSMPALSLSDHARTLSGASSATGQSPPRTPGSAEDNSVLIHKSLSSSSAGLPPSDSLVEGRQKHSSSGPEQQPTVVSDNSKPARPSLLQMAQSQRSTTTILEQEEAKTAEEFVQPTRDLSALGLAPAVEIAESAFRREPSSKKEQQTRQIRLPRKSRKVLSQYTASELAAEMKRILTAYVSSANAHYLALIP